MNSDPGVDIVVSIVTWRAPRLTIDCLASLAPEVSTSRSIRVLVVDNASGDGTAEAVEEAIQTRGWSGWVDLIRSPINGGFAAGNNIVCREAARRFPEYRYMVLLNPDTVALPGALRELCAFMDRKPKVGIAGGRCENPDGTVQESCFRFPGIVSEFADQLRLGLFDRMARRFLVRMGRHTQPVEVDWVVGALMVVRRKVFDAIGLMDESYFLYYEETDFSLRARRAGWPTWHVPSSRAVHFVGQLTGVQSHSDRPKRLPAYWFESRRRYFVVNYGLVYAIALDLAVLIGDLLWALRVLLERRKERKPPLWIEDLVSKGVLGRGKQGIEARRIR